MKLKKPISDKTRDTMILLLVTLGLAAFGIMVQLTENSLQEAVYWDNIGQYWGNFLLSLGVLFLVTAFLCILSGRHPFLYKNIQLGILLLVLGVILYTAVDNIHWNFRFGTGIITIRSSEGISYLNRAGVMQDALLRAKLFGTSDPLSTDQLYDYEIVFQNWEADAVLPVIAMYLGSWTVVVYFALAVLWLGYAIRCGRYIAVDAEWVLLVDAEKIFRIDLSRVVYVCAVITMLTIILAPILSILGLFGYYCGIPFCSASVAHIRFNLTAEFTQLAAIGYLLYPPSHCTPVEEPAPDQTECAAEEGAPPEAEPLEAKTEDKLMIELDS